MAGNLEKKEPVISKERRIPGVEWERFKFPADFLHGFFVSSLTQPDKYALKGSHKAI